MTTDEPRPVIGYATIQPVIGPITTPQRPRDTSVSRTVGRNVRRLRRARRLSQEQLAERLGWHRTALTEIENVAGRSPRRAVTVDQLVAVAKALDVDPARLINGPACTFCCDAPPSGFACKVCAVTA